MGGKADGSVWIKTVIDNSDAQKRLDALKKKIFSLKDELTKNTAAKNVLTEQAQEYSVALDAAKAKLHELKAEQSKYNSVVSGDLGLGPEAHMAALERLQNINAAVTEQENTVNGLEKEWGKVNDRIDDLNSKIKIAEEVLEVTETGAGELVQRIERYGGSAEKMAAAQERAADGARKFALRLREVARSALIFTVISQGLAKLRELIADSLKTNEEYTSSLAQMKAAWLTAFQPVWAVVVPALLTLMRILTAVGTMLANVFSFFSGKSTRETADNAKALDDERNALEGVGGAADDAAKSLAGFDEINKLSEPSSGGGGGGSIEGIKADFDTFNTQEYKDIMDELTAYISGALLGLGAILAFSGTNIPLGLALMAAGAVGLASVAMDWAALPAQVKEAVNRVLLTLSGAALAVGAFLAMSGVNIPLGLSLMAAGAVGLAGTAAINWDAMTDQIRNTLRNIGVLLGGALLGLGVMMALSGNAPIGLALMAAGVVGMVTAVAVNWNSTSDEIAKQMALITGVVSAGALVLGAILLLTGGNPRLGLGLLISGAAGLTAAAYLDWDYVLTKLKVAWIHIKRWWLDDVAPKLTLEYWTDKFSTIGDGLVSAINAGIELAESALFGFFGWVGDKIKAAIDGLKSIGDGFSISKNPNAGQISTAAVSTFSLRVPQLASGAVIPPNREFMAILGDQKQGYNVEAPLETIMQAVMLALKRSGYNGNGQVIENIITLDGEVIYQNQKQIERQHGDSLTTGGDVRR